MAFLIFSSSSSNSFCKFTFASPSSGCASGPCSQAPIRDDVPGGGFEATSSFGVDATGTVFGFAGVFFACAPFFDERFGDAALLTFSADDCTKPIAFFSRLLYLMVGVAMLLASAPRGRSVVPSPPATGALTGVAIASKTAFHSLMPFALGCVAWSSSRSCIGDSALSRRNIDFRNASSALTALVIFSDSAISVAPRCSKELVISDDVSLTTASRFASTFCRSTKFSGVHPSAVSLSYSMMEYRAFSCTSAFTVLSRFATSSPAPPNTDAVDTMEDISFDDKVGCA